jgi:Xaa-Pro aminopeptidase
MSPYQQRRQRLQDELPAGILILPTAPEQTRNNDCEYPYRFDSNFYYLTGFTEPEAVLVQVIGDNPKTILFCRDKHEDKEIWYGYRCGPEKAKEAYQVDETYSIESFDEKIAELLVGQTQVYFPIGQYADWDQRLTKAMNHVRAQARNGTQAPSIITDIRETLGEMRVLKDSFEVSVLRRAAKINTRAHRRAMQMARPGLYEYSIEAELMYEYYRHGSRFPAYTNIVAAGANSCILHYVENNAPLKDGDLLLIDAGCELEGYASDITRTFPVNGKFTAEQKAVYEIVLAANQAGIEAMQPGNRWSAPHEAALNILAQGLIDLGLCEGTVDGVIESEAYKQFYMHKIGHWMGLDVHDAGQYKRLDQWRIFQPGIVMTIEPGLYIRPAPNVPENFANIGIRIEDDILVTETGYENLTLEAPKSISDIENLMRRG